MGFLAFAASFFFAAILAPAAPAFGQFPIRQIPQNWGPHPPQFGGNSPAARPASQSSQPATTPHPAVARISVPEKDGISFGSGTLIDARGQFGLVVTNWHVVRDAAGPISVQFADGFQSPGQVVKTDKDWDLAALSIRRPQVQPLPITPQAPQPGETLTIAGYGSGDYRVSSGRCTQYLAPGEQFPYELIELAAEARQGDSGGPIFNDRGEICGVLFGSGPGYTSGSYGGRVRQFLAAIVPGGEPGSDHQLPAADVAATAPPANTVPNWVAKPEAPSPHTTALHQPQPVAAPPYASPDTLSNSAPLTPALMPIEGSLLEPPARSSDLTAPADFLADEVDPRAAVENRVAASLSGIETPQPVFGAIHTPLPPRGGSVLPPSGVDLNQAPPDQLLAAAWQKIGGNTALDQGKTALALVGILSLLIAFWRISSRREPEVQEE